jgi:branched-subunit amino acid ABC-type transport system permease component
MDIIPSIDFALWKGMDSKMFIEQIINGLTLGSTYSLIALGYTMVYGILELINFAHSEIYMIGAFFRTCNGIGLQAAFYCSASCKYGWFMPFGYYH